MKKLYGRNLLWSLSTLSFIFFSLPVFGEIEKHAYFCETKEPDKEKLCFNWFPKLPLVKGWNQDKDYSLKHAMNAQVPDGKNITNADTTIYGKALYKKRTPAIATLHKLIENDHQFVKRKVPGIHIREVKALTSRPGIVFQTFDYEPEDSGTWGRVSFGEERASEGEEYYIIITLSSKTHNGFKNSLKDYEEFIKNYK